MKRNKSKKIIYSLLIFVITLLMLSNFVNATDKINPGAPGGEITKPVGVIIGVFQVVTVGVAAVMIVVLAIKYMGASPSEKAEIKKHAVVYIVGAVLAFGASGVLQIVKTFVNESIT